MKQKRKFKMNANQAENTLANVFSACDIKMKLQEHTLHDLQQKYHKESRSYHFLMWFVCLFMLIILLAPLCFKPSPAKVTPNVSTEVCMLSVYEHHVENNIFYITLTGGEVDYANISIIDDEGQSQELLSFDPSTATISFAYTDKELNLYIPDVQGHVLQLLLTPKNHS